MVTNENGDTVLMAAVLFGRAPLIAALLRHCPKQQVLAVRDDGASALTIAASLCHLECIDPLLAHHPSSQRLDAALVHLAAAYKAAPTNDALKECCEKLLALGAICIDPETADALRPIVKDMAQRARIPHLINEAVVTALAHVSGTTKRDRSDV